MKPVLGPNGVPLFIENESGILVPAFAEDPCTCCDEISFEDCGACVDEITGVNLTFSGPESIPCEISSGQIWYPINDSFSLTNQIAFPPGNDPTFDITFATSDPCDEDGILFAEQPTFGGGTFFKRAYIYRIVATVSCIDPFTDPKVQVQVIMHGNWWESDPAAPPFPYCSPTSGFASQIVPPIIYTRAWDEVCNQQLSLQASKMTFPETLCDPSSVEVFGEVGLVW